MYIMYVSICSGAVDKHIYLIFAIKIIFNWLIFAIIVAVFIPLNMLYLYICYLTPGAEVLYIM